MVILRLILFVLMAVVAYAQPTYTTITDTIYTPVSGVLFTGVLSVSGQVPVGSSAATISQWTYTIPVTNGGPVSFGLVPNTTATPSTTVYVFRLTPSTPGQGAAVNLYCTVPVSASPVKINTICTATQPSTVTARVLLSWLDRGGATTGQVLGWNGTVWAPTSSGAAPLWGNITGTLSDQTDLSAALAAKLAAANNLSDVASAATARTNLGAEPTITAGTTSQYWRGDKTFQALTTTAVTEGANLYFTNARAISALVSGCSDSQILFRASSSISCNSSLTWTSSRFIVNSVRHSIMGPNGTGNGHGNSFLNIGDSATETAFQPSTGSTTAYGVAVIPKVTIEENGFSILAGMLISPTFTSASSRNVTNIYGHRIVTPTMTGSITATNAYGLWVDTPTFASTINRALHVNGASYLDGNTTIGSGSSLLTYGGGSITDAGNGQITVSAGGTARGVRLIPSTTGEVVIGSASDGYGRLRFGTTASTWLCSTNDATAPDLSCAGQNSGAFKLAYAAASGSLQVDSYGNTVVGNVTDANDMPAGSLLTKGIRQLPVSGTTGYYCLGANDEGIELMDTASATKQICVYRSSTYQWTKVLTAADNLASLGSASTARTNLGLATVATSASASDLTAGTLPVARGGTGTGSTLTGLVRGSASAMTAAELSGDVTTSGSNATTIANGAVTNAKLANSSITVNGVTCTLGSSCTPSSSTRTWSWTWGGAYQAGATGTGMSLPTSNSMVLTNCVTETICSETAGSTVEPWLSANANQSAQYASLSFLLPTGYTSNAAISYVFAYTMNNTTGTPKVVLKYVCTAVGANPNNPTYASVSTITLTVPSAANYLTQYTGSFTPSGCSAGNALSLIVQPDTTTGPLTSKLFFYTRFSSFSVQGGM